jgi:putative tricarboxylic transport membrane protein
MPLALVLATALTGMASHGRAQATAPAITIVAPAAPGGGWDQTARAMQQALRATGLAGPVQVVNAAGAAGTIGLARFVRAERGNPNALLVTGLVMVSGIAANRSPVTLADVTPVARLSGEYEVIVVPAASPHRTLDDLVAAFRATPRAVSWGGGSAGGTDEILVRLLADRVGVPRGLVTYVAYSGGGQALASVLGGHVTAAVSGLGEFAAQLETGALRALAISAPERVHGVPIPTFREQGVDLSLLNWRGVVAPPGLSHADRGRLEHLVTAMARSPAWQAALGRGGWADLLLAGEPFARFIRDETARIAPIAAAQARGDRRDWYGLVVQLVAIACLGAYAVVRVGAGRRADRSGRGTPPQTSRANLAALGLVAAGVVGQAALLRPLGFVPASALLFVAVARAFGSRHLIRDAFAGVALALAVYVAFSRGLGLSLPAGPFGA